MTIASFFFALSRTVAGAALAAGGVALADNCTYALGSYTFGFMPDFDQKRANGPLVFDGMQFSFEPPGLPNNGAMYCVPTSHLNSMAYLANHGFPALMPGMGSSPAWSAPGEYKGVTERLRDLGATMHTSSTGGTGDTDGTVGSIDWFEAYAPGKFVVAASYAKDFYAPSLDEMALAGRLGGLVHTSIGWYENTGPNQWKLDGGHRVTMIGAQGLCGSDTDPSRKIRFRDPASGGSSQTTQSAFATTTSQAYSTDGFFGSESNGFTVYFQRTQEHLIDYSSSAFVKGYRAFFPEFGVTLQPPGQPGFSLVYPIQPTDHPHPPPSVNAPLSAGASAASVALDPTLLSMYYVVKNTSGVPDARVFKMDRQTGASQVFYTGTAPRCVETGRFKEVYIIDGSTLIQIDPYAPAQRNGSAATPFSVDAIAYDDTTDRLVALAAAAGKIILWTRDMTAAPQVLNLPPSVALAGAPFLAVSPQDGSIWLRSQNSANVYKLSINAGGGLMVADTVSDPLFVGTLGLDVQHTQTREHILLARQVGMIVYEKTPTGWSRSLTSEFAGLPSNGLVRLARSRENFDPESMSGPDQRDVLPVAPGAEMLDCPGDLNGDGVVNAADLALLLGSWGADPTSGPADLNRDGVVNSTDLAMLLGSWGACV